MRRRQDERARSKGQAMLEFALVAPIFILILITMIEFGRAAYYVQMLDNAAREGARYATVHGDKSGCPSGPPPPPATFNPCDHNGIYVEQAVKRYAIAVIDNNPAAFTVIRRWCEPTTANCGSLAWPGDGDNARGSQVYVQVNYTFRTLLSAYFPISDFTLTGRTTAVVNH